MRLIDADAFNKQEVLGELRTAEFDDEIQDVIDNIPTAYDVDKVVGQLEKRIENFKSLNSSDEIIDVAIKEIQRDIEIVKFAVVQKE